jgi:hypothetical protein
VFNIKKIVKKNLLRKTPQISTQKVHQCAKSFSKSIIECQNQKKVIHTTIINPPILFLHKKLIFSHNIDKKLEYKLFEKFKN